MVSATDPRPEQLDNEMVLPTWLFWLQLGLSTTLAVLFVVSLVKIRQQSLAIRGLQDKVAGIENRSALDRTTAIEDQLRTTSERLQALERVSAQVATLSADNSRLRQELRGRSAAIAGPNASQTDADPLPPLPPLRP